MYKKTKNIFGFIIILSSLIGFTIYPVFSNIFTLISLKQENSFELFEPKTSANEILINTPENKTYGAPMSGYYPATYGFENDMVGSDPAEWNVFEGAGYVNVKDEMNNHKSIVEMYDNTNANHDELHNSFSLQTNGAIEFWVLSDDVAQTFSIIILDDTATSVWGDGIGWLQIYQNKFRYEDNAGWHVTTKTLNDNIWYHVKVEFECSTGNYHGLAQDTWRFYVDGEEFGDFSFAHDINNVSQVYFATRGADMNYKYYVDAVGYSWDPEYIIGDNAQEGLLLSFNTVFTPDWLGYSLDGLTNKTILGNTTFPMPAEGSHNIQVFGNDTLGALYQSEIQHFSINYVEINYIDIFTPEDKAYSEPMSGYYPATYGFENDIAGSDPVGWNVFEGAGYVNVKDEMNNHKNVIEMYDNTNANHDELHNSFSLQTNGAIEFWVLSDDVAQTFSIIILDDTATSVWGDGIGWLQIYQNKFRYEDNAGWHVTTKTLNDNIWYHVKVEFECSTGNYHGLAQDTWRFYVDGEEFGDFSFAHDINNVSQVYFATRGADMNYKYYVDAVGYSWDPEYIIGDNAQEGLLLSFNTVFTPDWLGYSLDGLTNKTILGNTTFPMPAEGSHNIQVFGNDTLGTLYQSEIRYFTTDTIAPTSLISFTPYRVPDMVIRSTVFTITADDGLGSGISLIRYKINNSIWFDYLGPFDLSNYDYGEYVIIYQAIDVVGNIEVEHEITVILIPEPSDPGIPGYHLYIMICIISIVSAIIIKRRFKNKS